jgi:transposase
MARRNEACPTKSCDRGIANPNASRIDVGSASRFVAIPPDRDDEPVREFESLSEDLERLADWLIACGIDMVAIQSRGVYSIPLFELLEPQGVNVYLVNSRHVKNVSGRKSDVLDCQWPPMVAGLHPLRAAFCRCPPRRARVLCQRPRHHR